MKEKICVFALLIFASVGLCFGQSKKAEEDLQYKLLATTKTSTMQKELDETAAKGYRIIVGSPTSGTEIAIFLERVTTSDAPYKYKLLATTRTGTMQKELNEAAVEGYRLLPRTMIAKAQLIAGVEIVMILEKPPVVERQYDYKLLATNLTGTLQKEVTAAEKDGYVIVGMVSRGEHMVIMERESNAKTADNIRK